MAATIAQACPKCGKVIKAPADLAGKKVRCKGCAHIFLMQGPSRAAGKPTTEVEEARAKAKAEANDDAAFYDKTPYKMEGIDLAPRCPRCAGELESEGAKICLHCGYDTEKRVLHESVKVYENTAGDYFLWWLPAIICIILAIALIVTDVLYCLYMPRWFIEDWDKLMAEGANSRVKMFKTETEKPLSIYLFHPLLTVWSWVLTAWLVWKCGKFAFVRLALNPHPPEVEKEEPMH